MKKLLVLLVSLLLLVGCASESDNTETTSSTEAKYDLIEEGVLYVGTSPDYPPYETIDEETGEMVGFDIDLANKLGEIMGLEVVFSSMEFSTIVSAVQTKQVDLGISGFSYDPEKQVLFSDAYYTSSQTILYLADDEYSSIEDFNGLTVAAQLGTTCYDLMAGYTDINTVTGTDAAVLVEALRTGAYDGVCLDTPVATNYVNSSSDFKMLDPIAEDSYSVIASSDNELLIEEVNKALEEFMQTDEYADLLAKWGLN